MKVLELEDRKGEWGFKALKQMMKIMFRKVQHVTMHNTYIWMFVLSEVVGVSTLFWFSLLLFLSIIICVILDK